MAENHFGEAKLSLTRSAGFSLEADIRIPGEGITVLFGPSGCGKTTVLRCVAGLERAKGVVRIGGELWQDDARGVFRPTYERSLGYVFQEASLFAHLNVEKNLTFGLERTKVPDGRERLAAKAEAHHVLELLEGLHLARRVALQCKGQLLLRNAAAVVGYDDALQAPALDADLDAVRARVDGVLHELLDDGGGALDHLARGDLADELVGEFCDGSALHHSCGHLLRVLTIARPRSPAPAEGASGRPRTMPLS